MKELRKITKFTCDESTAGYFQNTYLEIKRLMEILGYPTEHARKYEVLNQDHRWLPKHQSRVKDKLIHGLTYYLVMKPISIEFIWSKADTKVGAPDVMEKILRKCKADKLPCRNDDFFVSSTVDGPSILSTNDQGMLRKGVTYYLRLK